MLCVLTLIAGRAARSFSVPSDSYSNFWPIPFSDWTRNRFSPRRSGDSSSPRSESASPGEPGRSEMKIVIDLSWKWMAVIVVAALLLNAATWVRLV